MFFKCCLRSFTSFSLFIIVFCASCDVKEDRSQCPCRLMLSFSQSSDRFEGGALLLVFRTPDDSLVTDTVTVSADGKMEAGTFYEVDVPRGDLRLTAITLGEVLCDPVEGMIIPVGSECPPVFLQSELLDTRRDVLRHNVVLCKNYCLLTVRLEKPLEEGLPFALDVTGGVNGYSAEGNPLEGAFRFLLPDSDKTEFTISLPRQLDNSLLINLLSKQGKTLRSFAFGEYVEESGYDWTEADLKDLSITIDYSSSLITFQSDLWSETLSFEIVV